MDASRLTVVFAILIGAYGFGRLVFGPVSRTGDIMAALFVPPDRTLGWPRGVQERDDPWAWRPGLATEQPTDDTAGPGAGADLGAVLSLPAAARGGYVEPPRKVTPIRFRALP